MARPNGRKPRYMPNKVTFAGVDDKVEFGAVKAMADLYSTTEWAVLVHPEKHGTKRYPTRGFVMQFADFVADQNQPPDNDDEYWTALQTSLHLCGGYVDDLLELGYCGLEHVLHGFQRVQINIGDRDFNEEAQENVRAWARHYETRLIIQVKAWPQNDNFMYLLDRSRGKGVVDTDFPNPFQAVDWKGKAYRMFRDQPVGFAGGISPENVLEICHRISDMEAYDYNIDMESGVRDANNEFSLERCEAVMTTLYEKNIMFNGRVIAEANLEEEREYQQREEERQRNRVGEVTVVEDEEYVAYEQMAVDAFMEDPDRDIYLDDLGRVWRINEDEEVYLE